VEISSQQPDLSSEEALLLNCAPTSIASGNSKHITALAQGEIDWDYFFQKALQHRVMPGVCRTLWKVCPDTVPPPILKKFRQHFSANAARNLFMSKELVRVLSLFERTRIQAIPYKGPVFAAAIYGNLAYRQFGDLDILVREQDYDRAQRVLVDEGFRRTIEHEWETEFQDEGGRIAVDLHRRLAPPEFAPLFDFDYLGSRLRPVTLAGASAFTLCPEDTLLALSIQIAKDGRVQLSKLCDIAELLVQDCVNMEQAIRAAKRLGASRMLLYAVQLTNHLFVTALPRNLKHDRVFESRIRPLLSSRRQRLFHEDGIADHRSAACLRWILQERFWDKLRFRLKYLRDLATPCELDRLMLPIPDRLAFLYYLVRPIRLMRKYALLVCFRQDLPK
jgi:hypothetical protein